MNFSARTEITKRDSLLSFFHETQQDNLDFLGNDVRVVFWSYDLKTGKWLVTGRMEQLFGYSHDELAQFDFLGSLLVPKEEEAATSLLSFIKKQVPIDIEYELTKKDGTVIWVKTKGNPVFDSNKNLLRYNGVSRDITDKVLKQQELAENALHFQTLLEKSAQAVYISQDGKYQYATEQMAELTGYSVSELIGMSFDCILDDESIKVSVQRAQAFLKGEKLESQEITIVRKDKSKRIAELRSSLVTYKSQPALMGTLLDVTQKKQALERANHLAYHDTLTELPNRNLFFKQFEPFLASAQKSQIQVALLFIKLNQLQTINETFGHSAGDAVIKEAGIKMKELTSEDGFTGRYGDDEFVIYFPYASQEEVQGLANGIIQDLPHTLSSDVKVKPTIGISLFPEHGNDADTLLRFADIAMYQSKLTENSEWGYRFYTSDMMEKVLRTNKLTHDLQKGIELNQFHLVYQPKVWLASGKLEGVEALLRWEHPNYGNISPIEFIPLAEKSGHIIEIGEWVLEKALQDIKALDLPLTLNVNISMRQLLQPSFTDKVKSLVEKRAFPPNHLNLEITESVVMFDIEQTIEKLLELKNLGIKISLDDFGTGFSSLSYLTILPIDCLKIDRSFISRIKENPLEKKLLQNIISGAHDLNMEVVAEGIETEEQAQILRSFSCAKAQGYYFSKPLPFPQLLKYVFSER
ncbi:bifunctional diguanylate cyclase/phosphodiesterase [Planomicrobium sp. Y74]|uniref:bifunctional diguanylate cyclase/phosphodiesterase n=1 Tax=Planomicrobium sp. Y74 TaxID=2478977 RepID=UPI000EF46700|nr:bifunctional diguanylate cyclase/phosphodiesterase [Planomicrobium sp. Y74]RLQ84913.1 bifunctional diguanylate cyclase/phosphodiesterase [Planomicrobium sp. Y74]